MPDRQKNKPLVIAGPCCAESLELMQEVGKHLKELSEKLGFSLIFKASFDKANRTSISGKRGIGLEDTLKHFDIIKKSLDIKTLTDCDILIGKTINLFYFFLTRALENKDLEIDELLEFPIFEEMRDSDKFEEFKKNSKFFKKLIEEENDSQQRL